jgi:hypothetical protein
MKKNASPKLCFASEMMKRAGKKYLEPIIEDEEIPKVTVIRPIPEALQRPETPFILEGTMRVVGDMFRKKLITLLSAKQEDREKFNWFSNTEAREVERKRGYRLLRTLRD